MLQQAVSLFAVLALAFFASRILLRVPVFPKSDPGLVMAHLASAALLIALVIVLKFPAGGFVPASVAVIGLCQAFWFAVDRGLGRQPTGRVV